MTLREFLSHILLMAVGFPIKLGAFLAFFYALGGGHLLLPLSTFGG